MIEKVNLRQVLFVVGIGLALCFMFRSCGTASPNINRIQNDTDRAMATTKTNASALGVEIGRVEHTAGNLGETVNNAIAGVERSQEAAETIAGSIDSLKHTIRECQILARENSKLIEQLSK